MSPVSSRSMMRRESHVLADISENEAVSTEQSVANIAAPWMIAVFAACGIVALGQMQVTSLKTQGPEFLVCNNTLKGRKIRYENDLFEVWEDNIVPSGVAELSHLQQQGYTYIKP